MNPATQQGGPPSPTARGKKVSIRPSTAAQMVVVAARRATAVTRRHDAHSSNVAAFGMAIPVKSNHSSGKGVAHFHYDYNRSEQVALGGRGARTLAAQKTMALLQNESCYNINDLSSSPRPIPSATRAIRSTISRKRKNKLKKLAATLEKVRLHKEVMRHYRRLGRRENDEALWVANLLSQGSWVRAQSTKIASLAVLTICLTIVSIELSFFGGAEEFRRSAEISSNVANSSSSATAADGRESGASIVVEGLLPDDGAVLTVWILTAALKLIGVVLTLCLVKWNNELYVTELELASSQLEVNRSNRFIDCSQIGRTTTEIL